MAATANYGWVKPTVGGSTGLWGTELNAALDEIDADLDALSDTVAAAAVNAANASNLTSGTVPDARLSAVIVKTSGSYANPAWIASLAPSKLTQSGATSGQVLAWNGSAWAPSSAGGGGGDTTSVSNSGAGVALLKTGTNVTAKTLLAGSGVSISGGTDEITISASGVALSYSVQSSNFTAAANTAYFVTGNSVTVTLPASPANGDFVYVANGVSVTGCVIGRNSKTIMGLSEDMTIDTANFSLRLVYRSATGDWRLT